MTPWLVELPQARTAPEDIRRRLRELDPTAEIVYLGFGRWSIGRVRPTNESVRIATRMIRTYWSMKDAARASRRGVQRYRFAEACRQGFRPVAEYTMREPDDRIVKEFQASQYRMLNQRTDLLDEFEQVEAEARAERQKDLRDEGRARETLNYVKQSNFGRAVSSVAPQVQPERSGWTRHSLTKAS